MIAARAHEQVADAMRLAFHEALTNEVPTAWADLHPNARRGWLAAARAAAAQLHLRRSRA